LTPKTSGGTATGEKDFTADTGAPTTTSDPQVWEIQEAQKPAGGNQLYEVGRTWQFKGRFSGSAAAAGDVLVTLWCYDRTSEQWYATAAMQFFGTGSLGTVDNGSCKDMAAVIGTSHIGAQVVGIATDQDFHLMMYESGQ
jgi:hypothetical protein